MPEEIIPEEEKEPIATPTPEPIEMVSEEEAALNEKEKFAKLGPPKLSIQDISREEAKKNLEFSKKAIIDDVKKLSKKRSDIIKKSKQEALATKEEISPSKRLEQIDSIKLSPIVETTKSTSEYDGLKKELDSLNTELTKINKEFAESGYPVTSKEPIAKEEELAVKEGTKQQAP